MNRRDFLKSSFGCVCLAMLPPIPPAPKEIELGELSDFSRDYGTHKVEDVMFENDIHVIAMKEALQMPPSDLRWREVK